MTTKTDGDRLLRAAVALLSNTTSTNSTALRALVDEIAPGRVERERARIQRERARKVEAGKWRGPVPAWAKRLVAKHLGDHLYQPLVVWHPRARETSSGRYRNVWPHGSITVEVGSDPVDQHRVLLHEIAHARTEGHGHDEVFWDELYRLAVIEGTVTLHKARTNQTRSFTAAQRRARKANQS